MVVGTVAWTALYSGGFWGRLNDRRVLVAYRVEQQLQLQFDHIAQVLGYFVEGAEYAMIDSLCYQGILPQQLMMEFTTGCAGYRLSDTKKALATLRSVGYRRCYISESGRELGFLSF